MVRRDVRGRWEMVRREERRRRDKAISGQQRFFVTFEMRLSVCVW
jgi:hypothetical protein